MQPGAKPHDDDGPGASSLQHVGPYKLLREIGRGGMGTVYLAERAGDSEQRRVALKLIRAQAYRTIISSRLDREAQILSAVDHPNIVRLIEAGASGDGLVYLVMEYVEGTRIDEYCDSLRLSVRERMALFLQLCSAVDYLHRQGIVHRDLKPGNILVEQSGNVKLLDFGIARMLRPTVEETLTLTQAGLMMMTPTYASPEQIRSEPVSAATDIYSLGLILYELLTGHWPYRIESFRFHEIARAICEGLPRRAAEVVKTREHAVGTGKEITPGDVAVARKCTSDELSRNLRGNIDCILQGALAKDPRDRYRSTRALSDDVTAHLDGHEVTASRHRLRPVLKVIAQHRTPIVAAAALIVSVPTGAVRIGGAGWITFLAAAVVLALWWAATDPKIGERIAESPILKSVNLIVGLQVLVMACDAFVWPPYVSTIVLTSVAFLCTAWLCTALVGWLEREKWGGPLLLDASLPWKDQHTRVILGLYLLTGMLINPIVLVRGTNGAHRLLGFMAATAIVATVWLVSSAGGKLEFRQRGIVWVGRLYRWNDVDSFEWDTHSEAPQQLFGSPTRGNILKLRIRRKLSFLPPVRIPVTPERVQEANSLLSRLLSSWPPTPHKP